MKKVKIKNIMKKHKIITEVVEKKTKKGVFRFV